MGGLLSLLDGRAGHGPAPGATRIINARKVVLQRLLGEGGSGTVWLARDVHAAADTLFALKIVRLVLPEHIEAFKAEATNHQLVAHRGIAPAVAWTIDNEEGLLLLPFYPRVDKGDRDLVRALAVLIPVAEALVALHSLPVPRVFRDIKPANILVDRDGCGVLIDLGSVTEARVNVADRRHALQIQDLCAQTVTAPFRPPELFDVSFDAQLDERTDVFSFGCTIYAAMYGQSPFDGSATAATSGRVMFVGEPVCPLALQALLRRLMNPVLSERPFMPEVLTTLKSIHASLV